MKYHRRWTRRDFLRAAGIYGGASALLPLVPSLGEAQEPPKRLVLISTGNGSILSNFRSNGAGDALVHDRALPALRGPILEPLNRHRAKLVVLDGIDMATRFTGSGQNGAHHGQSILWTGRNGGGVSYVGHDGKTREHPNGPSIDQVIADRIGTDTAIKSIQIMSARRAVDGRSVNSYTSTGGLLPPQTDPRTTYDRLFRDFDPTPAGAGRRARQAARRQRSFAVLRGEITRLRNELNGRDRDRFEQHVASVDALESRLTAVTGDERVCDPGTAPNAATGLVAVVRSQIDLIATAFACDRTRVVTWMMTPENEYSSGNYLRTNVPGWTSTAGPHSTSHTVGSPNNNDARDASDSITALNRWQADQLATLLDRLGEVEDAPGVSALDNTIIVWGTAMSQASVHTNRGTPMVIAQGANGPFRAGRYLRFGEVEQPAFGACDQCHREQGAEANNRVLVSVLKSFGIDQNSFGDPAFSGELPGLR